MARKATMVRGTPTDLAARMNAAAEAGGGIQPTTRDRFGNIVKPAPAPKPIGNSSADRHAARAAEFAMSEAERQKLLDKLDRMSASDRAKKK